MYEEENTTILNFALYSMFQVPHFNPGKSKMQYFLSYTCHPQKSYLSNIHRILRKRSIDIVNNLQFILLRGDNLIKVLNASKEVKVKLALNLIKDGYT